MRTSMTFLFSLLILCLLLPTVNAQGRRTIKQLKFAPGTSSTIVKGTVTKDEQVIYELEAKKGQRMRVKLIGKAKNNDVVLAEIQGPNGESLLKDIGASWNGKLPQTGNYAIAIGLIESKSGSYSLEVIITN